MAQFKQATPTGKKKSAAAGGGKKLLPPVREPKKPVPMPIKPNVTHKTAAAPTAQRENPWEGILNAAAKGTELPDSLLKRAQEEVEIGDRVQRAGIDTVSGAAPTVKKDDQWRVKLDTRRQELEREAFGAKDFQAARREGAQVKPQSIFMSRGERAVRTVNDATFAKVYGAGDNQYAMESLQYLTAPERAAIQYYAGKGEYGKVEDYVASIQRELNGRLMERKNTEQPAWAAKHPFQATGAHVVGALSAPGAYLETLRHTGENTAPPDLNSEHYRGIHLMRNTEQGITSAAGRAAEDATGSEFWGNTARGAAGLGLGVARFAPKLLAGPVGAAVWSGAERAGVTATDALERGGSATQAAGLGTAAGTIEAVTQLLPMDRLFGLARSAPQTVRALITDALQQAGLAGGQAVVSQGAEDLMDTLIMGDQSRYNSMVRELEAQGYSGEEAAAKALGYFWLQRPLGAAQSGALAGGLSAMLAGAVGIARQGRRGGGQTEVAPTGTQDAGDGGRRSEQDRVDEGWTDVEGASVRGPEGVDISGESGIIRVKGQTKDGLGELEWSKVVSKRGESRQDHLSRHSTPMPTRAIHGVFSGNPLEMVTKAWAQRGLVAPLDDGMGCYIYNIPFPGAGYDSGYLNPGAELDFITVIVLQGTSDVISVFPSDGRYGK